MAQQPSYPVPPDEAERLAALRSYHVLGTGPEPEFDTPVRLARRMFGTGIAFVSFVGADEAFLKAQSGLDLPALDRRDAFCAHTILGRELLVVPDARLDQRFSGSPLVRGGPRVRFHAGAPLVSSQGHAIGTLSIQDVRPRPGLAPDQRAALADLASIVMERLEVRRSALFETAGRRRFEAVVGSSVDAVICADGDNRIVSWNGAAEKMFGYAAAEVLGRALSLIVPPRMRAMHEEGFRRATSGAPTKLVGSLVRVSACRKDESEFPIELSLCHWTEAGEHRFGAIIRDVTERLAIEQRLKHAAAFDALTDLANRSVLAARLGEASAGGRAVSLILLDLDGFKDVNDSLGHAAGDEVLRTIGSRLREEVGEAGLCCRLGGDEFVVLIEDRADPLAAAALAERVIGAIERPIELGETCVYVGASGGIALCGGGVWDADRPLADADLALYRAKADGKGRVRLFSQDLRPMAQSRVSVSSGLRQAFERGEFELYYQPQVRLSDEAVIGAEALLRWNHPERGVLTPAAFLSTLETSLIAVPVSEWILRTACVQAAAWRTGAFPDFRIGVNLFAAQFRSGDLPEVVAGALEDSGLPAAALELEITENTILRNETRITAALRALREMGVGVAFDDYGTGYASLTMLKDHPVTRLKIDRSFVMGIGQGSEDRAIVQAIRRLARGFGLDVIAEGIETRGQADLMRRYCTEAQGYLFGRPMPAGRFEVACAPAPASLARSVA